MFEHCKLLDSMRLHFLHICGAGKKGVETGVVAVGVGSVRSLRPLVWFDLDLEEFQTAEKAGKSVPVVDDEADVDTAAGLRLGNFVEFCQFC